jgi:hypothetical protein
LLNKEPNAEILARLTRFLKYFNNILRILAKKDRGLRDYVNHLSNILREIDSYSGVGEGSIRKLVILFYFNFRFIGATGRHTLRSRMERTIEHLLKHEVGKKEEGKGEVKRKEAEDAVGAGIKLIDSSFKYVGGSSIIKQLYEAKSIPSFFLELCYGKIKIVDRLDKTLKAIDQAIGSIRKYENEIKNKVKNGDKVIKKLEEDFKSYERAKKIWKNFESQSRDEILKGVGEGKKDEGKKILQSTHGESRLAEFLGNNAKMEQYIKLARSALDEIFTTALRIKNKLVKIEKEL